MAANNELMFTEQSAAAQRGFTLLEALISLLIIALGLLGLAGLQTRIQQAEFESYQRSQAIILLYDMVDRIQLNREAAFCFAFTANATSGTDYVGTGGAGTVASLSCGAATGALALTAITEWHNALLGAAETKGGNAVGAMLGARGCVHYDAASEISGNVGTGIYTVSVSWQGTSDTAVPAASCGNTLYGAETKRRTISTTLRLAKLS